MCYKIKRFLFSPIVAMIHAHETQSDNVRKVSVWQDVVENTCSISLTNSHSYFDYLLERKNTAKAVSAKTNDW